MRVPVMQNKLNDSVIRQTFQSRRKWNWQKCVPLQVLLWALGMVLGALVLMPMLLWLAKGVIR